MMQRQFDTINYGLFIAFVVTLMLPEPHFNSYCIIGWAMFHVIFNFQWIKQNLKTIQFHIGILLLIALYNLIFWGGHSTKEILYFSSIVFFPCIDYQKINFRFILYFLLIVLCVVNTFNYAQLGINYWHQGSIDSQLLATSLYTDRPYNSLYIYVISLLSLNYVFSHHRPSKEKWLVFGACLYLFSFFVLFMVRMSLLLFPIIAVLFLLISKKSKIRALLILIVIGAFLSMIIWSSSYGKSQFEMIRKIDDPRVSIWHCAREQLHTSWQYGSKELSTKENLNICFKSLYDQKHPWEWIYRDHFDYDCHNQYLEYFLRYGIVGLLIFTSILLYLGYKSVHIKNYELLYTLVIFGFFFLIESILQRHKGLMMFSFLINLTLQLHNEKSK